MAKSGISANFETKDILASLKSLPVKIQKNVMVGATRAGTKPVIEKAKSLVPRDTGNLAKSIGITRRKSEKKTEIVFSVSPRKRKNLDFKGLEKGSYSSKVNILKSQKKAGGYYAHMIEFGTSKMPPHPFMRPAFESQTDESLKATKDYMKKRLPQEIAKARK